MKTITITRRTRSLGYARSDFTGGEWGTPDITGTPKQVCEYARIRESRSRGVTSGGSAWFLGGQQIVSDDIFLSGIGLLADGGIDELDVEIIP